MSLVTVTTCADLTEALVLRSRLEAAGVPAFLPEMHHLSTAWHLTMAVGVRLQVPEAYRVEAETLLSEWRQAPPAEEAAQDCCPRCRSTDIHQRKSWLAGLLALLAVMVPLPVKTGKLFCRACGQEWRDAREA